MAEPIIGVYNGIADNVSLLPLRGLQVSLKEADGNLADIDYVFYNLEKESSYRIDPITRTDDKGRVRRLAYRLDATIYIPYSSDLKNFILLFEAFNLQKPKFIFFLGSAKFDSEDPEHLPMKIVNATSAATLSCAGLEWSIAVESVEYRPRVILKLSGINLSISYGTYKFLFEKYTEPEE